MKNTDSIKKVYDFFYAKKSMEQMRATIPALTRQNSPIWSFDKNSQN